jgi:GT2 family glycosyltransferase
MAIATTSSAPRLPVHQDFKNLSIAVGIATRGRPEVLRNTLQDLIEQKRSPDATIVAYTQAEDIRDLKDVFPTVIFLQSLPGLTRQRNTILRALGEEDVVLFLDDDFYLDPDYILQMSKAFLSEPDVVVATGAVLADGINTAGLSFHEAKTIIGERSGKRTETFLQDVFNAYGCNMCLRLKPIRENGLFFDEALPLYGWYEDVDFSRQLARFGRVVKVGSACGVHLGVKGGRQSGVRLGYSQVANPVYLARKNSVSWMYAISSMLSRSLKNLVRCAHPEAFVDRKGRLQGNLKAWGDLIKGEIRPEKILDL